MFNRGWLWVFAGGVLEAVYPALLNLSHGLSEIAVSVLAFAFSILATILLNFGLKRDLPIGPSYAVWVGIGVGGIVIIDALFFGEVFCALSYVFLAMIFAGVVGLNLVNASSDGCE